jgi:hypothetical protein
MSKIILQSIEGAGDKFTIESKDVELLDEVLDLFTRFLDAAGFERGKLHLDFVDEEETKRTKAWVEKALPWLDQYYAFLTKDDPEGKEHVLQEIIDEAREIEARE